MYLGYLICEEKNNNISRIKSIPIYTIWIEFGGHYAKLSKPNKKITNTVRFPLQKPN